MARKTIYERDGKNQVPLDDALDEMNGMDNIYFKGREKDFENYIIENTKDICAQAGLPPVSKIEQQKVIQLPNFKIIIDIFIIHKDNTGTIFEVKKTNLKYNQHSPNEQLKSIGQLMLYRNVVSERFNTPRVYLVSDRIFKRTFCVFKDAKLPINLMQIQNDKVVIIDNH